MWSDLPSIFTTGYDNLNVDLNAFLRSNVAKRGDALPKTAKPILYFGFKIKHWAKKENIPKNIRWTIEL